MKQATTAKDSVPTLYDVLGDEIPTFPADPKDLDLAKAIRPRIKLEPDEGENVYSDGEILYYCVELEVPTPRSIGNRERSHTIRAWCRTCYVWQSGGYMDPPELDEHQLDDGTGCWRSLADAARATAHDVLDMELDALDNTCYECFGCGKESPLDESGDDCQKCGGLGFIPCSAK